MVHPVLACHPERSRGTLRLALAPPSVERTLLSAASEGARWPFLYEDEMLFRIQIVLTRLVDHALALVPHTKDEARLASPRVIRQSAYSHVPGKGTTSLVPGPILHLSSRAKSRDHAF
jgi:hypothetical protein